MREQLGALAREVAAAAQQVVVARISRGYT
jgi:hypothetical protein